MLQTSDIYFFSWNGCSLSFPALKLTCPDTPSYKVPYFDVSSFSLKLWKWIPCCRAGPGRVGWCSTNEQSTKRTCLPTCNCFSIMCLSAQYPLQAQFYVVSISQTQIQRRPLRSRLLDGAAKGCRFTSGWGLLWKRHNPESSAAALQSVLGPARLIPGSKQCS